MSGRLISLGQVVMDLVMYVPTLPRSGGDVYADASSISPGGAFNAMAAASRDGATVVYAGGHGTGHFGDLCRQALQVEGIAICGTVATGVDTGFSVVFVQPSAERSFASARGAECGAVIGAIEQVKPTSGDIVFMSGYSFVHTEKRAALVQWLDHLPDDVKLAFDPGPLFMDVDRETAARVMQRINIWSGNLEEAIELAGPGHQGDPASAIAGMLAGNVSVIVRMGPAGCVIVEGGRRTLISGFSVAAVDTNGAGDAHSGVLLAGLLAGLRLPEAATRANAAASIAVTRRGPATSPTRAEIDAFLADRA